MKSPVRRPHRPNALKLSFADKLTLQADGTAAIIAVIIIVVAVVLVGSGNVGNLLPFIGN
jgi:hypothetical protein